MFTPAQPEIFAKISLYITLAQPDFTTLVQFDFRTLHLHNLKSLSTIWFYTTLAQPDFHYIRTTWLRGSTPAQPEIFIFIVKWYISRYTRTPWFSLHLQNIISLAFSFLLCVYVFLYIHISYLYLCLNEVVALWSAMDGDGIKDMAWKNSMRMRNWGGNW